MRALDSHCKLQKRVEKEIQEMREEIEESIGELPEISHPFPTDQAYMIELLIVQNELLAALVENLE